MPNSRIPAGQPELRRLLQAIYDGLGQPPLGGQLRVTIIAVLDVLAEQDLERRFAVREQLGVLLAEARGGEQHPQ
jgi:hypothetical protein